MPLFEEFLRSVPVQIYRPTAQDRERAQSLAHPKDVPILAAAIGTGTPLLVTHCTQELAGDRALVTPN